MKTKLPWVLFAASLLLNIAFLSGSFLGADDSSDGAKPDVAEVLELDSAQQQALTDLRAAMAGRREARRERRKAFKEALIATLKAPAFDATALEPVLEGSSDNRRLGMLAMAEGLHGLYQTLTPEQRRSFKEAAEERRFLWRLVFGPKEKRRD